MKSWIKKLSALGLGLLFSLFLLELILRAAPLFFLQAPFPKSDPKAYRIVCVGDSSTYGLGVDPEKNSYPVVLQALLSQENKTSIQVFNLGLPGINSSQALERLRKNAGILKPNLILIGVGINDPWNLEGSDLLKNYSESSGSVVEKWKLGFLRWIQKSKLRRFVKLLLMQKDFLKNAEPCPEFNAQTVEKNNRLLPDIEKQNAALRETLRQNFLKFTQIAAEQHAQIFFLECHAPGWHNPEQIIHALYQELNLNVIPVFDVFQAADAHSVPIRSKDNWHPNEAGYRLLAELVCAALHSKIPVHTKMFDASQENWKKRVEVADE